MPEGDALTKAWGRITGQEASIGRAGYIPVWDTYQHEWRLFRNTFTIYQGAENCADPEKVEHLRRNAANLIEHYPETIGQLEKLGMRVKRTLASPIKTPQDVVAWAESVFNSGPVAYPEHVVHTQALAYDDFIVQVQGGRDPVYVIPAGLRGSGNGATLDFSVPGKKTTYGARSEFSRKAFATQDGQNGKVEAAETKVLGRPRTDGLVPGSAEAKAADAEKKRLYQANRRKAVREATAAAAGHPRASVTAIADAPKRRLIRRPSRSA